MTRWQRHTVVATVASCFALLLWAGWRWQQDQADEQLLKRGAALFHGQLPLVARLQGHAHALPPMAVRCSNCHEAITKAPAGSTAASADGDGRPYAGALRGTALTALRTRRGGPPSAYDERHLCELLRTGIDPAQVMIPDTMPRYEPTPADCAALWAFLRRAPY